MSTFLELASCRSRELIWLVSYSIVIISNQAVPSTIKDPKKRLAYEDKFLNKIPLIAAKARSWFHKSTEPSV